MTIYRIMFKTFGYYYYQKKIADVVQRRLLAEPRVTLEIASKLALRTGGRHIKDRENIIRGNV